MNLRAIDANIILRFVTADHPEMSPRCRALFDRVQNGQEAVFLPQAALSDVVWTLRSFYKWPLEKVCAFLGNLLSLDGVHMQQKEMILDSLNMFEQKNIDFSDALIAAEMSVMSIEEIRRMEPA